MTSTTGKRRGVTLIELMVVLGVIAIIVGMSLPGLVSYAKQIRLKTTTRELLGLLSLARSLAITSHEAYAVVVDREGQTIRVMKVSSGEFLEQVIHLPPALEVTVDIGGESSDVTQLAFRPTGALDGRTTKLILADRGHRHTITVTSTTGAMMIE